MIKLKILTLTLAAILLSLTLTIDVLAITFLSRFGSTSGVVLSIDSQGILVQTENDRTVQFIIEENTHMLSADINEGDYITGFFENISAAFFPVTGEVLSMEPVTPPGMPGQYSVLIREMRYIGGGQYSTDTFYTQSTVDFNINFSDNPFEVGDIISAYQRWGVFSALVEFPSYPVFLVAGSDFPNIFIGTFDENMIGTDRHRALESGRRVRLNMGDDTEIISIGVPRFPGREGLHLPADLAVVYSHITEGDPSVITAKKVIILHGFLWPQHIPDREPPFVIREIIPVDRESLRLESTRDWLAEEGRYGIIVNGIARVFDQPPLIVNGRLLVPFRTIFSALGAIVDWDHDTQTATAVREDVTITLRSSSYVMRKNGEEIPLDVAAVIEGDRILVPLRAIAESLGAEVDWDYERGIVTVTEPWNENYFGESAGDIVMGVVAISEPFSLDITDIDPASLGFTPPEGFEITRAIRIEAPGRGRETTYSVTLQYRDLYSVGLDMSYMPPDRRPWYEGGIDFTQINGHLISHSPWLSPHGEMHHQIRFGKEPFVYLMRALDVEVEVLFSLVKAIIGY